MRDASTRDPTNRPCQPAPEAARGALVLTAMLAIALAVVACGTSAVAAPSSAFTSIAAIDLTKAFGTRSAWRFTAMQGPEIPDQYMGPIPGAVRICLKKAGDHPCIAGLEPRPGMLLPNDTWEPHSLDMAKLVYPRGNSAPPLFLIRTASAQAFNGDQGELTLLIAYQRASDRFTTVYNHLTWHNNNQEVRYITSGPLKGSVVSAEPAEHSPFGYWISVSKLSPAYTYRQTLHYLSATRYNDGNPLAVIDSEMPNIQKRLGIWKPGVPLPLPAGPCPKPRLTHMELWCGQS